MDGVTCLDLLAYRFNGNVEALMTSVVRAVKFPMIAAAISTDPSEFVRSRLREYGDSQWAGQLLTGALHLMRKISRCKFKRL
jgi:hypothetical protein